MLRLRILLRRLIKRANRVGAGLVTDTAPARYQRGMSGGIVTKGFGDDVTTRLRAASAIEAVDAAASARRTLARGWDWDMGDPYAPFWGQTSDAGPGDAEQMFDTAETALSDAADIFGDVGWSHDLIS